MPSTVVSRAWRAVLPLRCAGCGRAGDPVCPRCAAGMLGPEPCPPPAGVDAWFAPFAYTGTAREMIARVKYHGAHAATGWLADAMAAVLPVDLPEAVTWAPTTTARRRSRGFDHADLLARRLAAARGLAVQSLLRRRAGPPQTGLPAAARHDGPRFVAVGAVPSAILIVDDVATTGATLAAAARALRAAGASTVAAVTAARTPIVRRSLP